jgi:putative acetyltransferase
VTCDQTFPSTWTLNEGELDFADVKDLLASHVESMRQSSPPDACHVLPADGLQHPSITFFSLRESGRLLGVGALKELDRRHGEVKSMRTARHALGTGVGKAMLTHIVATARTRGYDLLSLETGSTEPFAAALHLYERFGFAPCGPFADYRPSPFTRFFTLAL